jgi:DNA-binding CsgD family transcriptional regulator/tetratricopeptide (TPR) repeat protein
MFHFARYRARGHATDAECPLVLCPTGFAGYRDVVSSVPQIPRPVHAAHRDALSGSAAGHYLIPVRGRRPEVEAIERGFDRAYDGQNTVTVFVGDPGIGKTRLLRHALQQAQGRRWSTLVLSPDVDSHLSPFGALIDAVEQMQPPLLGPTELHELRSVNSPQYWLTRTLANRLESAASHSGVLVVADDLQWLDSGSLATITALLRALEGLPIYWVFATRTGSPTVDHRRFVDSLSSFASVIDLAPLDADAVDAMARDILGGLPGPNVETAIKKAAGSPLLILELLRGMESEGLLEWVRGYIDVEPDTVPSSYGASVRERISSLSGDARRIAQVGSLYGREFPLHQVLESIGQSAAAMAPAVQELLDLSFIVDTGAGFAFRHDTVQSAASESLSPTLRRAIAGEVLHRRLRAGEPVVALASTIAAAAESGNAASIDLLFDAAVQLAPTDARGAAELVARGAELARGSAQHSERIATLLPLMLAGGLYETAQGIRATVAPSLSADARAQVGLAFARQLTEADFEGAIAEADSALAIGGVSPATAVQLLAVRALNYANKADAAGLRDSLHRARQEADRERDTLAVATLDATESVLLFNENQFDAALRMQQKAVESMGASGTPVALWLPEGLWMSFMLNSLGRCEEALRAVETGLGTARHAKHAIAEAYWMMVRARVLYDMGRLDEAREQAETVLELSEILHLGDFANATAGVVLHRIAIDSGDVELRAVAQPLVEALANGVSLTRTGRWSLALDALDRRELDAAYQHARLARESLRDPIPSMTSPANFEDDVYLAYICKQVGDARTVAEIERIASGRAAGNPGNALVRAVVSAVRGIRDSDFEAVMAAVTAMKDVPRPLMVARLLELAGSLAPTDQVASETLRRSLRGYEEAGAARDATRILRSLRDRGVRTRIKAIDDVPMGLSKREYQVAERMASGMTTQQIADDLLVSPHTVVTHIRHIFTKWGVNTRREAAKHFREASVPR